MPVEGLICVESSSCRCLRMRAMPSSYTSSTLSMDTTIVSVSVGCSSKNVLIHPSVFLNVRKS